MNQSLNIIIIDKLVMKEKVIKVTQLLLQFEFVG